MPELITKDTMRIDFIFTDWQSMMVRSNPKYPSTKIAHKEFKLMSLDATETMIKAKLNEIRSNAKKPQDQMVRCTPKELWMGEPSYKFYSNPAKIGGRCTKRFDSLADAQMHKSKVKKGAIVTVHPEPKACKHCNAFAVCEQRKEYFND